MKTISANLRVSVLGAGGVGKSAIIVRYLTRRFIGEYSSGLDISYQTTVMHGDKSIKVDILDTSSQKDCLAASHDVYDVDAFVVVYCVTDEASFQIAAKEVEIIRSRSSTYAPILLLGNKLDLNHARKVCQEDVESLSGKYACQHVEVSAAECHVQIMRSFHCLILDAYSSLYRAGRTIKRRKSLFENVSRKIGNVFRRKSLEDALVSKNTVTPITHRENRRSV